MPPKKEDPVEAGLTGVGKLIESAQSTIDRNRSLLANSAQLGLAQTQLDIQRGIAQVLQDINKKIK